MNPNAVIFYIFAACIGFLIGGPHTAVVYLTIALGLSLCVGVGQYIVRQGQIAEAQKELEAKLAEGGAGWDGIPPDVPAPTA